MEARYDYSGLYRSFDNADMALSDMFAFGDVCEAERPEIEKRLVRRDGKTVARWVITLPM